MHPLAVLRQQTTIGSPRRIDERVERRHSRRAARAAVMDQDTESRMRMHVRMQREAIDSIHAIDAVLLNQLVHPCRTALLVQADQRVRRLPDRSAVALFDQRLAPRVAQDADVDRVRPTVRKHPDALGRR